MPITKEEVRESQLLRITGTPENFLTSVRKHIWGLNKDNKPQWQNLLLPNALYVLHSKIEDSKFFKPSLSRIIGIGRVSPIHNPFKDEVNPIWIEEKQANAVIYPYRFHFSEMALFTRIKRDNTWDSTERNNQKLAATNTVILQVLHAGIPMNKINEPHQNGFPTNGSISHIDNRVTLSRLKYELEYCDFINYPPRPDL